MDVQDAPNQAPAQVRPRDSYARFQTVSGAGFTVVACVLGLIPTLRALREGTTQSLCLDWDASHGAFCVGLDPLSAFFLLPILGLSALAAIYGGSYLWAYRDRKSLGVSWFFFALFVASMVLVVLARTALLFLVAWEVMSLSAFFLVTFEHEKPEVRRAGWIYLISAHLGVAFIFGTFLLLGRCAGGLNFDDFQKISNLDTGSSAFIFVFALIGFGAKAGLVPFHVWLPEAHPAAPSHVSALMSGVMIKLGLYGLLRVMTFLGKPPLWWGPVLAGIGLATGIIGVSLALYQRDVKRVLAYSSIENMGLIVLSLGVGLWGEANRLPAVAALGVTGALLHVWNHSLMKGLMFLAAGSVLHGTGTKDMERLGGLMKRMPWTATAMILGAVAIAGLPPLNGFVSEWLMYLGLMKCGLATGGHGLAAFLAVGLLALIGGLASIAFVRLTGIALLGSPRSEGADHAHESSPWMLMPLGVLLILCFGVAVAPTPVARLLSGALDQVRATEPGETMRQLELADVRLSHLGEFNIWIIATLGVAGVVLGVLTRRAARAEGPTWGCGYMAPTVRMQYTGRSFAEMVAEHLLPRFFRPRTKQQAPAGLFPGRTEFLSECPDPIIQKWYEPFFGWWGDRFARLRVLQQGKVNVYLAYIMLTVVFALAWVFVRTRWGV